MHLLFLNEVLWKLRPIFDTHHPHESQISRVALFFAASFFLPLFSYSFFLGKTDSYRKLLLSSFLAFSPFFRSGFTRCRVFLSLRRRRKRTIRVDWTFGSQTMEIKIMKNRFSWLWVLKQNCFIFLRLNASKKLDIAQNPSRKVLLDHYRQDNKWRLRS